MINAKLTKTESEKRLTVTAFNLLMIEFSLFGSLAVWSIYNLKKNTVKTRWLHLFNSLYRNHRKWVKAAWTQDKNEVKPPYQSKLYLMYKNLEF